MSPQQLEKRRRVMRRSMALGHCVCDVRQSCPCEQFKKEDICHCAGERPAMREGQVVRLTEHVRNGGCASKISKGVLHEVLAGLPEVVDPRVLVGSAAGDDAGVIMISEDTATILTVDLFSPSVDDPYTFGQIAAANSLSDIYAMGGEPQAALSIIGFPIDALPGEAMREILRGGADKMKEAGVPIVGGHSINDAEPKCGFAVVGTSRPGKFVRNAGAKAGDAIVLTKPLGSGIAVFAHQVERFDDAAMAAVARSMAALNRTAGRLMVKHGVHAATDVTGFSILGHMAEIVKNSDVEAVLDFDAIPIFEGVGELARREVLPGAVERNRESVEEALVDLSSLTAAQQAILYCPETSGGMLVFLAEVEAEEFVRELRAEGVEAARVIGKVAGAKEGGLIRAVTGRAGEWGSVTATNFRAGRDGGGGSAVGMAGAHEDSAGEGTGGTKEQPEGCTPNSGAGSGASCCAAGAGPVEEGAGLPWPAGFEAFKAYMGVVNEAGAIGAKHKKLMALALSVMGKCEPCVKINARAAREAGASEQEIAEAVGMGCAFGGATVTMFYNSMRRS